jgi:hypothetical protein
VFSRLWNHLSSHLPLPPNISSGSLFWGLFDRENIDEGKLGILQLHGKKLVVLLVVLGNEYPQLITRSQASNHETEVTLSVERHSRQTSSK